MFEMGTRVTLLQSSPDSVYLLIPSSLPPATSCRVGLRQTNQYRIIREPSKALNMHGDRITSLFHSSDASSESTWQAMLAGAEDDAFDES